MLALRHSAKYKANSSEKQWREMYFHHPLTETFLSTLYFLTPTERMSHTVAAAAQKIFYPMTCQVFSVRLTVLLTRMTWFSTNVRINKIRNWRLSQQNFCYAETPKLSPSEHHSTPQIWLLRINGTASYRERQIYGCSNGDVGWF